jgi:predicted CoA-binding protein
MGNEHLGAGMEVDFGRLFAEIKTVAVVGYSEKAERAGHFVAHYLKDHGYEVVAINPRFTPEINGLRCFAKLSDIPASTQIDVVDVFRAPEFVPQLVDEAAKMQPLPKYFWMQPGAENPAAFEQAEKRGMTAIMDACMMAAHKLWAV